MNATEIEIAAIAICTLFILIPVYKWLRLKYFVGPELTVEVIVTEAAVEPGASMHQRNMYEDENRVSLTAEQGCSIRIMIRNKSPLAAFSPKITFEKKFKGFKRIDELNFQESIRSRETRILDAEYAGTDLPYTNTKLPEDLENLKVLLGYTNFSKSKFYTIYDHQTRSNKRVRFFKPNGFSSFNAA